MELFSRDPVRIEDTAKRAITLDQLERVVDFVKEQLETGKPWHRTDTTTSASDRDPITSIEEVTLYDLNAHVILPATREHDCSLVELRAEA